MRDTRRLLGRGGASPRVLQRLLGRWVWVLILKRPLLSALQDSYTFSALSRPETFLPFSLSVKSEITPLVGLAPLLYRDLKRPTCSRMYATDASPWGAGVVYCDLDSDLISRVSRIFRNSRVMAGWYAFPDMPPPTGDEEWTRQVDRLNSAWGPQNVALWDQISWRQVVAHRWVTRGTTYHINVLEAKALVLAVRHMGRSERTRGKRIIAFLDSTVALGALAKGRSTSHRLNRPCRKFAAYSITADVDVLLYWVPTSHQPADAASRRHAPRRHRYHGAQGHR